MSDSDDSVNSDQCPMCLNREHTRKEHILLIRREYMRQYIYKRNEGRVKFRKWPLVPKTKSEIFAKKPDPYEFE